LAEVEGFRTAWLRIVFHFKAIAATAMRQILVDEARRRKAAKRGGDPLFLTLESVGAKPVSCEAELLDLDDALKELKTMNARQAEIVEHRFFGGKTFSEISEEMRLSESTIEKDWRVARAWLGARLSPATE
jgi:RNA polymerase sigma factor (TIGR02999 family)